MTNPYNRFSYNLISNRITQFTSLCSLQTIFSHHIMNRFHSNTQSYNNLHKTTVFLPLYVGHLFAAVLLYNYLFYFFFILNIQLVVVVVLYVWLCIIRLLISLRLQQIPNVGQECHLFSIFFVLFLFLQSSASPRLLFFFLIYHLYVKNPTTNKITDLQKKIDCKMNFTVTWQNVYEVCIYRKKNHKTMNLKKKKSPLCSHFTTHCGCW